MPRLAICSALVLISVVVSACATQKVATRDVRDIRDDILRTGAYMNRDIVSSGPF